MVGESGWIGQAVYGIAAPRECHDSRWAEMMQKSLSEPRTPPYQRIRLIRVG
jgi:hypothetical protein